MKITLSKIEAARNELREAIRLWFTDGDLASMHLLACSAHQIIADINAANGGRDLIYDSLVIRDEGRKEWVNKIKAAYNHLKHADQNPDPDHPIELDSDLTEFFILFTCLGIELLKIPYTPSERAFVTYLMLSRPDLLKKEKDPFVGIAKDVVTAARTTPKNAFFTAFLHTLEKQAN